MRVARPIRLMLGLLRASQWLGAVSRRRQWSRRHARWVFARSFGRVRAASVASPAPASLDGGVCKAEPDCIRKCVRPGRMARCGPSRSAWQHVDSQGRNKSAAESRPGAAATAAACSCPTAGRGRMGPIREARAASSVRRPIGSQCSDPGTVLVPCLRRRVLLHGPPGRSESGTTGHRGPSPLLADGRSPHPLGHSPPAQQGCRSCRARSTGAS